MVNSAAGPNQTPSAATERVVVRLRSHGRALVWPALLLIAVCGATGFLAGRFPEGWQNAAILIVAAALVVFLSLLPLLSWLARRYTITTRRVIMRSGFFVRTRRELLHGRASDIVLRAGWIQSLLGSGDVIINAGQGQPLVLKDVPNATLVQRTLQDLIENSSPEHGFVPPVP